MSSRWLIGGLVASLALNLFLIGAGAGVVALGRSIAREAGAGRPGALMAASANLPQPARHDFREMLRETRSAMLPEVTLSRAVRQEAWAALGDPKVDIASIKGKLAQSRQIDTSVRSRVEEKLVDYVSAMPPADRSIFAAGMRRALAAQAPPAGPATNAAAPRR